MARSRATGTPATSVLTSAGVAYTVHTYPHDATVRSYGAEAAAALRVAPERVLKTLITRVDGRPTVAVVPVSGQLDLKALAVAMGGKRAELADRSDAERWSGYVAGGISPIGQRRRLATVVDASVAAYPTVYVSAGRRGMDVELAPADLVAVTGAVLSPLTRG